MHNSSGFVALFFLGLEFGMACLSTFGSYDGIQPPMPSQLCRWTRHYRWAPMTYPSSARRGFIALQSSQTRVGSYHT